MQIAETEQTTFTDLVQDLTGDLMSDLAKARYGLMSHLVDFIDKLMVALYFVMFLTAHPSIVRKAFACGLVRDKIPRLVSQLVCCKKYFLVQLQVVFYESLA